MNWDTTKQTALDKNYSSSSLTVKSIRKFTEKEQEDLTKPRMNNKGLWPYCVEFNEIITQENDKHPAKTLFIFKNTYYYKEEKDPNPTANEENVFYYFAYHLNKKIIAIPFSKFYYNNIMNRAERLRFYCLSDSSDFSTDKEKKDVNKIITEEKTLWDKFKYTDEKDLVGENKKWVDAGVYQEYQKAFSETNLADKPAEVKKWQDNKEKTKLSSLEAAIAYENGWLSNEVKEKKGSLDGENYLYDNVLTLKKDKIQEEEKNKQTQQQRVNAIQEVKNHWNNSATNGKIDQKTISEVLGTDWEKEFDSLSTASLIDNKKNDFKQKIDASKNEKQQNQAITAIEDYWDKNKDSNGKINGQTIEQLLGDKWKDNFNSLTTAEEIKKEQDKLTAIIDQTKGEANKKICNIVEHQKIEEKVNQLTKQLLDIKRKDLERRIAVFGNEVNIDDNHLREKYSRNYKEILQEKLTLDDEQLLEDTLKAVVGLCATELSSQSSDDLADEKNVPSSEIKELLDYLKKVKDAWGQISPNISASNNPFYLSELSKQEEFRGKVDKLITSWEEKLKVAQRQMQQQEQTAQIQVNPQGGNK